MENFSITYRKEFEDTTSFSYYDFSGLKESESSTAESEQNYYMLQIAEIKKVIMNDFKRILENKICFLDGNEELVRYIEILLETYDNKKDSTSYGMTNFMILTDKYLCFNNIEDSLDIFEDDFDIDDTECETVVIVDRDFSKYYFITTKTKVFDGSVKTLISTFDVDDKKVQSLTTNFRGRFKFSEFSEQGVNGAIQRIKRSQQRVS